MKKILIALSLLGVTLTGCENFLDTENLTQKNTQNFPESEAEMNDLLTGVYYAARAMDMEDNANCSFVISEIMSDDRFAGGAPDDFLWANLENFGGSNFNYNFLQPAWEAAYRAIFRANTVITSANAPLFTWSSADAQKSVIGQAAFLRGYTFFNMARLFGPVPMPLTPDPVNLPRASADELYAQIAADMKLAIESMPATVGQPVRGRATKWAAEAVMARVWLFYTGYYQKDALPLPDGGSVTKNDVVGWLKDCIDNSGHKLVDDFRNLWPYSNPLTQRDGYEYAKKNGLKWVGEEGANTETVFSWPTAPGSAGWSGDTPTGNANRVCLYFSIRTMDLDGKFPFGLGWGFGTVNSQLWENWPDADPRKKGSIADVNDPDEIKHYEWGADNQLHDTGLWQKKYTAINVRQSDGGFVNFSYEMYGSFVNTDYQLNNTQDLITMRFADVLLMHSELTGTADGMTRVRARAGLDAVPYTVDALRNERRWELAFEGVRYYDLLRWGIAAEALDKQNGVAVKNTGVDGKMSFPTQAARLPQTHGLMPVPETQIELSKVGGVAKLTQTPGWER